METGSELFLNAIELSPAVKHATIVKTFDDLKPGESFILHNDHDPKPLYYQLSATKGDIFTWDYLQQGPDIYEIRIAKKKDIDTGSKQDAEKTDIDSEFIPKISNERETVRNIVIKDYTKSEVFKKYHIDFCFHADVSLKVASEQVGISEDELRKTLLDFKPERAQLPSDNWNDWEIGFLSDFILHTHHRYVKNETSSIIELSQKVAETYGGKYPELEEIAEITKAMLDDFIIHMSKEESVLFPAIKQMLEMRSQGKKSAVGGGFAHAIDKMEAEHDETFEALKKLRKLSNGYILPGDANDTFLYLYKRLEEFENDTYRHVHLENNILFPKSILLENEIAV